MSVKIEWKECEFSCGTPYVVGVLNGHVITDILFDKIVNKYVGLFPIGTDIISERDDFYDVVEDLTRYISNWVEVYC